MAAARRRGQFLGRRKKLNKAAEQKARIGESLNKEAMYSVEQIARELLISKTTLYKYLRQQGVVIGPLVQLQLQQPKQVEIMPSYNYWTTVNDM